MILFLLLLFQVDTIVFTGWISDNAHDRAGCTYAGTMDGHYIAWPNAPCSAERLAYLQQVAPMRVGTTAWYWIQEKRKALKARKR